MTFFGKCWPWKHDWVSRMGDINFIRDPDYINTRVDVCLICGKIERRNPKM